MPRPRLAWPERIPVRWRIAITCAGLTFLILVIFAGVLGNLVGDRVRDDFNDELTGAAGALAAEFDVGMDPTLGAVVEVTLRIHPRPMAISETLRTAPPARLAPGPGDPRRRVKEALDPGYVLNPSLFPKEAARV